MKICESLFQYVLEWLSILFYDFLNHLKSKKELRQENIALRSQLAFFNHQLEAGKRPKPQATPAFRQLWVLLSKYFPNWESCLVFFKPETRKYSFLSVK